MEDNRTIEQRHTEEMHRATDTRKLSSIDQLAESYGCFTRASKRAFKSNLRKLVRQNARATLRNKSAD